MLAVLLDLLVVPLSFLEVFPPQSHTAAPTAGTNNWPVAMPQGPDAIRGLGAA
jgi:hypothetical protein